MVAAAPAWWKAFAAWLAAHGAELAPGWAARQQPGARGVGLFAESALPQGHLLFALPPDLLVSGHDRFEIAEWLAKERLDSPSVVCEGGADLAADDRENGDYGEGEDEDEDEDGERQEHDDDALWRAYVATLPRLDESARMPRENLFFRAHLQAAELDLSPEGVAALGDDGPLDSRVRQALDFAPWWVRDLALEREWLVSLALVTSRLHMVWARDAFGDWEQRPAMVPLADLLNGASTKARVNTRCETDRDSLRFVCATLRPVAPGEELLVQYGDGSAAAEELRETYGELLDEVGLVGTVALPWAPAFLQVGGEDLYVSTFYNEKWRPGAGIPDALHRVPISDEVLPGGLAPEQSVELVQQTWPNEAEETWQVFSRPGADGGESKLRAVSVAGGFILGGKKGAVNVVVEMEDGEMVRVPVSSGDRWFYHRAVWADIDGDGDLDLLTVRSDFTVPPFAWRFTGQLLWFENTGDAAVLTDHLLAYARAHGGSLAGATPPWPEHIIDNGKVMGSGDVMLRLHDIEGDGTLEIVTTHFFRADAGIFNPFDKDPGPGIVVYALKAGVKTWASAAFPAGVDRIAVASDFGPPFDLVFVDLDGDGTVELLTSNHESDGDDAAVFAFEVPSAWRTEPWVKHVLARGFPNRLPRGMSPGAAQPAHPSAAHAARGDKPWIVLSGDGSGFAYVLVPRSQSRGDWAYEQLVLHDTHSTGAARTVGAIAITTRHSGGGDDDACTWVYVPAYEAYEVAVFDLCAVAAQLPALRAQTAAAFPP